jgi:hypothetical protein
MMTLVSANPSNPPRKKKTVRKPAVRKAAKIPKGGNVAKKKWGSPKQKAAFRKMIAARKGGKTHRNPSYPVKKRASGVVHRKRGKINRNPSSFGGGSIFKELVSVEGAMMVGAALAAPMAADFVQEKVMPSATGWVKLGVKAAVIGAGAFAIQKFLKKKNVALAFGVTGLAVLVSDAIKLTQGQLSGLSVAEADMAAQVPGNAQALVMAGYERGLADGGGYQAGLSGDDNQPFNPAFPDPFGA